jgi:queuine tRNA-ribosyltransferase
MYSVIHGGIDTQLRETSIKILSDLPFDGHAVGGSIGKNRSEMVDLLRHIMPMLTEQNKPIHLLGIGDTESIDSVISFGFDTFDSSYPTRAGRHGTLFTR